MIAVWSGAVTFGSGCRMVRLPVGAPRVGPRLAIETTLILGAVMRLPLRQTEGLVRSLMQIIRMTTRLTA
jgi:hypothetical protein